MKIETVEMIPMTKESPFEENAVVEVSGITKHDGFTRDASEWMFNNKKLAGRGSSCTIGFQSFRNVCVTTSQWVADNMPCAGFMLAPVAMFEDGGIVKVIEAKSVKVADFKQFVDDINSSDQLFYPYMVEFVPNSPVAHDMDPQTFKPVAKPYPVVSTTFGAWVVRYATLPKSTDE